MKKFLALTAAAVIAMAGMASAATMSVLNPTTLQVTSATAGSALVTFTVTQIGNRLDAKATPSNTVLATQTATASYTQVFATAGSSFTLPFLFEILRQNGNVLSTFTNGGILSSGNAITFTQGATSQQYTVKFDRNSSNLSNKLNDTITLTITVGNTVTPVPVPAAGGLLLAGLGALGLMRRRRKA